MRYTVHNASNTSSSYISLDWLFHIQTFSKYSTFVSRHLNAQYETHLVSANKIYAPSLERWQKREQWEDKLASSQLSYEAFAEYLSMEESAKVPDYECTKMLYERCLDLHQASQPTVWEDYLFFLASSKGERTTVSDAASRATRFQPWNGVVWAQRMKAVEKEKENLLDASVAVQEVYDTAMQTGLMKNRVDDLVAVTIGLADVYRRMTDFLINAGGGVDPTLVSTIVGILEKGREEVRKADKKNGDPSLRLEKYLYSMYERFDKSQEALELWQAVTKSATHRNSATAWMIRTELETRRGLTAQAHESYKAAVASHLDYPEYMLEKWIEFEHSFGTLEDLEYAQGRARKIRAAVARKREREYADWGQAQALPAATEGGVQQVEPSKVENGDGSMTKRKEREEDDDEKTTKKAKTDHALPPLPESKRDREHATVFVSGLSKNVTEDILEKMFRDCGIIREIKIHSQGDQAIATVEFTDGTSVPAAQTKDKKRIEGAEIGVHLGWQSTLYVTNFAEEAVDEDIRKLFAPYGTILDIRWPSRRIKSSRRFVYIQYLSPSSAQSALVLDKFEAFPGLRLSVAISAPEKKKARTDAGANERELYINGLSRFVNEEDLRKLFSAYGLILDIRLPTDEQGHAKGWAFIDFDEETSAKAALSLNNYELKKRRIAVTIADAKGAAQKAISKPNRQARRLETRNRSIRVQNVPKDTQEALLQQTFEKFGAVKQVVYKLGSDEAVIEFENEADVGKLLLSKEAITLGNNVLNIAAEGIVGDVKRSGSAQPQRSASPETSAQTSSTSSAIPTGNMGLMPRTVASRARGKLGTVRGRRPGLGAATADRGDSGNKPKGNDDFRKMLVD
ncbi:hypothetical protein BT69DRAFT_1338476 [Atractiella rhizophila]|nr:hypothetical protein BT69DRAFT_1338476 [Atractiella rhizophila]